MAAGSGGLSDGKVEIEVSHDTVHWVVVICVVSFVKDKETDVSTQTDVSVTESVEQNLRSGDYNTIFAENVLPQVGVGPLFWLKATVDESNQSDRFLDHTLLLFAERHSWCDEPRYLCNS